MKKDRLTPLTLEMKTEIRVSLSDCSQNIRKQKVLFKIIQENLTLNKKIPRNHCLKQN